MPHRPVPPKLYRDRLEELRQAVETARRAFLHAADGPAHAAARQQYEEALDRFNAFVFNEERPQR